MLKILEKIYLMSLFAANAYYGCRIVDAYGNQHHDSELPPAHGNLRKYSVIRKWIRARKQSSTKDFQIFEIPKKLNLEMFKTLKTLNLVIFKIMKNLILNISELLEIMYVFSKN